MSTKAKNSILAYIVMAMLVFIGVIGTQHDKPQVLPQPLNLSEAAPVKRVASYNTKEFECMRTNVFFEARDQSVHGMKAAALVVLTRMKTTHFPSTACAVVKAWTYNKRGRKVCQFSWYCDGKSDIPNLSNKLEAQAWAKADKVAVLAMEGKIKDFLGRATHYHATYVHPAFARVPSRYELIAQVGSHIFYHDKALKLKA